MQANLVNAVISLTTDAAMVICRGPLDAPCGEAPSCPGLDAGNVKLTMSVAHSPATMAEGWAGVPAMTAGCRPLKIFRG